MADSTAVTDSLTPGKSEAKALKMDSEKERSCVSCGSSEGQAGGVKKRIRVGRLKDSEDAMKIAARCIKDAKKGIAVTANYNIVNMCLAFVKIYDSVVLLKRVDKIERNENGTTSKNLPA